ncbi:MAG: 23S rRNA (pseudouridine(1915)-N(3))-methyltransferase RlmH [Flavobacteriales bacterium]|nr:23S rRNA (pseudouridine(1915)-N(3))-methyltransferase RlmH [Flavobacteriales bacterium]
MKITLFYIGKKNDVDLKHHINNYYKKINYFVKFDIVCLKPSNSNNILNKKKEEMKLVLNKIKKGDIVFLFDEKGDKMNSIKFSKIFLNNSFCDIKFFIGGSYGFHNDLLKMNFRKISLSDFVLSHKIALIVVLEQLYRSFTIINNHPYHNE